MTEAPVTEAVRTDTAAPDALFSVAGRRVVITGGTAGIGLGVAAHFVEAGASVVVTGRRSTGTEIAASVGAQFVPMDVTDDESVRTGLQAAAEALGGGIDVLILNAGIVRPTRPLRETDLGMYMSVMETNFGGVLRGVRFGLGHMQAGGVILVTSSPGGRMALGLPGASAYGTSKAAVDFFVQSAALELASEGIRVTGILPGFIETELGGGDGSDRWLAHLTSSDTARLPKDMAPVYQFAASKAGAMLQGAIISADDGCTAGLSNSVVSRLLA